MIGPLYPPLLIISSISVVTFEASQRQACWRLSHAVPIEM